MRVIDWRVYFHRQNAMAQLASTVSSVAVSRPAKEMVGKRGTFVEPRKTLSVEKARVVPMQRFRFIVQQAIKNVGRAAGVEIRYAFQNPTITDPRLYERWMKPHEVKCIFDIGANIGQSAKKFAQSFPQAVINSFEPFPEAFSALKRIAEASNGRIVPYQFACGDIEERIMVSARDDTASQLNSISNMAATQTSATSVEINVRRIDSICAEHDIQMIDLLKTDTEGFDGKVLDGAADMLSTGRVRCVVSEVGFMDDCQHTHFNEIFQKLSGAGYELAGLYELSYLKNGRCDFANALFVRRSPASPPLPRPE